MSQPSFVAGEATAWGPGYDWAEIRSMLEALVDEGIIKQGEAADDPRGGGLVPSQVPPSVCPVPRMWSSADCEAITRELGGRPIEIGHLEAVVQAYRIAHPALDADGRQVGEANVFPPGLRLDRPTEWRVCQYAGSRYRDDAPMNVTALKAMIKYWKPMLAALGAIRAELLGRLPRSRDGWRAGDLHTFSRAALAIPAYLLMKRGGESPQPLLHPVLSTLYRVIDGIRMTTHDMLFLSAERTRHPDELITAAELHGFAERNGLFLSEYGVCAGPRVRGVLPRAPVRISRSGLVISESGLAMCHCAPGDAVLLIPSECDRLPSGGCRASFARRRSRCAAIASAAGAR